ncbi:MAG: HupE/UreJ family protein [Burkholderiales bacterium]
MLLVTRSGPPGTRAVRRLLRRLVLGIVPLLAATAALAHPMPESRLWIDTVPGGVELLLQLPLNRLEHAYGTPLADAPAEVLARHGDGLARYLAAHVTAGDDDARWSAAPVRLEVTGNDASAELQATLRFAAPAGADPRAPRLRVDAIVHEVRTHRIVAFLRSDWAGGFVGSPPRPLGGLRHGQTTLVVPLDAARPAAAPLRLAADGAAHIAEGTDHLLFLLMLLLVAPLEAAAGRWAGTRAPRDTLRRTAVVVTAFTAGHAVALAVGGGGAFAPPERWVEIGVAATVALAAVHALRPLATRGEAAAALAFGTVHGFAFAAALSDAGLATGQRVAALAAFNVGIEAMQLAAVAVVLPALLAIRDRAPGLYDALRRTLAGAALVVAFAWIAERAGWSRWLVWESVDVGARAGAALVLAVWAVAGVAAVQARAASRRSLVNASRK